MYPILFRFGPFTVYTYGVCLFLGVIAGYLISASEAKKQGVAKDVFSNIFFWTAAAGFFGAKILYILIEPACLLNPLAALRSGFVFYGGVLAGIPVLYVFSRKYRIPFLKLADSIALGLPLAHVFGRIGCFAYGCCYGKPTASWMGVEFPPGGPAAELGVRVIPTQLISAFFLLLIFFILLGLSRIKKVDGEVSLSYLVLYGAFRFIIEFFRGDPRGQILFLSTSQCIALILVIAGVIALRHRKRLS